MHNLEQLISQWRKSLKTSPNLAREMIEELENHLRDTIEAGLKAGMSETETFNHAAAKLGTPPLLNSEFGKLKRTTWLPMKIATGTTFLAAVVMVLGLAINVGKGKWTFLLGSHVFAITIGYSLTLVSGLLGICFVCQSFFSVFSPSRMKAIAREISRFTVVAACMTALGTLLGAVWAKGEWGRFWAWDIKETGGVLVLVWQVSFFWIQRLRFINPGSIISMTILGNVVVILSWFGSNLTAFQPHFTPLPIPLITAIILHLACFALAFVPAENLRFQRSSG